ncbi:MAG: hypothetical protein LUO87_00980 [Methanomicrobiales archaeon]|nr:hypothetical protein [Methanomicrobiales archaeon]
MPPTDSNQSGWFSTKRIETIFLVILLLTSFLSAFCAYQANRWNGVQSAKYQEASTLRTESVRAFNDANTRLIIDLNVFLTWADAVNRNDSDRARAVASRFTPEFKPAFAAWIARDPGGLQGTTPNGTPFSLPEYHLSARDLGTRLEENATAAFTEAQHASDIGTSYILTTLICAIVLFLCGVGEEWANPRLRIVILGTAIVFLGIAAAMLAMLPKIIF